MRCKHLSQQGAHVSLGAVNGGSQHAQAQGLGTSALASLEYIQELVIWGTGYMPGQELLACQA